MSVHFGSKVESAKRRKRLRVIFGIAALIWAILAADAANHPDMPRWVGTVTSLWIAYIGWYFGGRVAEAEADILAAEAEDTPILNDVEST